MLILVTLIFSKYFYLSCMTSYFTFFLMDKFSMTVQNSQLCLFAFLAASALGTVGGGLLGDKYGRKYIIWGSILGAAPFALLLPHVNCFWTIVLSVIIGLVISSAFSSIVVYATDLMPDRIGMISGVFFGLMFGLGGIGLHSSDGLRTRQASGSFSMPAHTCHFSASWPDFCQTPRKSNKKQKTKTYLMISPIASVNEA